MPYDVTRYAPWFSRRYVNGRRAPSHQQRSDDADPAAASCHLLQPVVVYTVNVRYNAVNAGLMLRVLGTAPVSCA
jgi:hypothetical protein